MPEIQVQICAYGPDALHKIASLRHDPFPGVEYLIGWQNYDKNRIPASIASRKDFRIIFVESIGLCNNRNSLLQATNADFVLISDDDLEYHREHFAALNKGIVAYADYHFLTFRYASADYPKSYPPESFNLSKPPKGYFVTSMELLLNMTKIRADFGKDAIRFNPAFGINGTLFPCGEEDVLIHFMLQHGMMGRFIPSDICINTDSTTSERIGATRGFIETKGAVISIVKPSTRYLRMLTHAWRSWKSQGEGHVPFLTYCRWWLAGEKKLKKTKAEYEI